MVANEWKLDNFIYFVNLFQVLKYVIQVDYQLQTSSVKQGIEMYCRTLSIEMYCQPPSHTTGYLLEIQHCWTLRLWVSVSGNGRRDTS